MCQSQPFIYFNDRSTDGNKTPSKTHFGSSLSFFRSFLLQNLSHPNILSHSASKHDNCDGAMPVDKSCDSAALVEKNCNWVTRRRGAMLWRRVVEKHRDKTVWWQVKCRDNRWQRSFHWYIKIQSLSQNPNYWGEAAWGHHLKPPKPYTQSVWTTFVLSSLRTCMHIYIVASYTMPCGHIKHTNSLSYEGRAPSHLLFQLNTISSHLGKS